MQENAFIVLSFVFLIESKLRIVIFNRNDKCYRSDEVLDFVGGFCFVFVLIVV